MTLNKQTQRIRRKYDRFSKYYDSLEKGIEKRLFAGFRKKAISHLDGNILEIGVGTGKNLPYYNKNKVKVQAIDISPKMLNKAKVLTKKYNLNVELKLMDAQKLKFEDETFDYVTGTFVLCSIPNPRATLKEIKRVLKKDGKIIFIEHVLSKNKFIALFQHLHNPITESIFGFNVNRNTRDNIIKSKFKILIDKKLALFDIFRYFKAEK